MRRLSAGLILVAYLGCALALPELHRRHHAAHGADHQHVGDAIVFLARDEHSAFDADLAALELAEVASAGTLEVDCELSAYTLVTCAAARPGHAATFGDELLVHHPHPAPPDPDHGRGALAHLHGWLLAPAPLLPPPPPGAVSTPPPPRISSSLSHPPAAVAHARGPPAAG